MFDYLIFYNSLTLSENNVLKQHKIKIFWLISDIKTTKKHGLFPFFAFNQ